MLSLDHFGGCAEEIRELMHGSIVNLLGSRLDPPELTAPAAPVPLSSKSQFAANGSCLSFAVDDKHTRELLREAACVTGNALDSTVVVYETLKPSTSGM